MSLLIKDKVVLFIINLIIKIVSIVYILFYIRKENLNKLKCERIDHNTFKLIPLLLLCASNFVVVLFQKSSINTSIDIFEIITGLILSIGVGIIEELLFRSQVLEEFLQYKSKPKALLYSSLIFSSVHLLNISSLGSVPSVLIQVGYTFYLGLVVGVIYLASKNIFLPIVFHILFNFLNDILVAELFVMKWDYIFFLVNILLGVVLFGYLLLIFKNKSEKGDDLNASTNLDN